MGRELKARHSIAVAAWCATPTWRTAAAAPRCWSARRQATPRRPNAPGSLPSVLVGRNRTVRADRHPPPSSAASSLKNVLQTHPGHSWASVSRTTSSLTHRNVSFGWLLGLASIRWPWRPSPKWRLVTASLLLGQFVGIRLSKLISRRGFERFGFNGQF